MANSTLKIKRSSTSIAPAVLNTGELAYTFGTGTDANQGGRLFVGGMGTNSDLQSALAAPIVIGGKYFTDMVDAATSVGTNNTLVKRDGANTAVLNITGNASTATTAGTVTSAAQTSITSVGTLTDLTLSGAITGAAVGNIIPFLFSNQDAFPTAGVLNHGAIAHSHADGRMYFSHNSVWNAIANSSDATSLNTASKTVTRDASGNFTAGTITAALSGNATTATAWAASQTVTFATVGGSITDATASFSLNGQTSPTTQILLRDVNVPAGAGTPYGSTTAIPVITVNSKGLVTSVSIAEVATVLKVQGTTGLVGELDLLTDTLNITAGAGLTTSFNNTTNTLLIGLSGTASLTALTLSGQLSVGSIISIGSITTEGDIEGFDIQINGSATIEGNLHVKGTTTTVDSTTVTIKDLNINVASDANTNTLANGGGLTVGTSLNTFTAATITYSSSEDAGVGRWNLNKPLNVSTVYGALSGNATTASTWANERTFSFATGDVSGNFTTSGSTNVSDIALTLATQSGLTAASYGTSVTIPNFTINAKGLVTVASSTPIPNATLNDKGLASFDFTQFTVTSGAVSISQVDGGTY